MANEQRPGSILAADVGTATTRAILIDTVDGVYRFVALGEAPTTEGLPWEDVGEGLREAVRNLGAIAGRYFLDENENLIMPESQGRFGVDNFVATTSAGQPIRTILVGLAPDLSLESARRASEDTYLHIADVISRTDGRNRAQQVDAILDLDPDLIVIVGGTEGGASHALSEQVRTIAMSLLLVQSGHKPHVIFAGNSAMRDEVNSQLAEGANIEVLYADNVRPGLDVEHMDDLKAHLGAVYEKLQAGSARGFGELKGWSEAGVRPTAKAFARVTQFMGRRASWNVLGVDVGSSTTTVATALGDDFYLKVYSDLGVGHSAGRLVERLDASDLTRWLVRPPVDERDAINYAWNKSLFPNTVPESEDDLDLELALLREAMRVGLEGARQQWPAHGGELLPAFGEILAAGSALGKTPHPGYSALAILDAIQPVGVTRLRLDAYGLAAALGSLAELDSRAAVEIIEAGSFLDLGTAISTIGQARAGQVVLRVELTAEGREEATTYEIEAGSLMRLPLEHGRSATLTLRPRGVGVGLPPRARTFEVVGGALGIIVDARGRPLQLPKDDDALRESLRQWQDALARSHSL